MAKKYNCKAEVISERVRRLGNKMGIAITKKINPIYSSALDAYLGNVIKTEYGCWGWKGYLRAGYGAFRYNKKDWGAHVFSYLHYKGKPGKLFVCHTCDNPICSNPDHLFLGTYSDNIKDCRNKNRNKRYILTVEKVVEIKTFFLRGSTNKELSVKYGVSPYTIKDIRSGKHWGDISIPTLSALE